MTHLPYRSWCTHCVRGRGEAHPHTKSGDEEHVLPPAARRRRENESGKRQEVGPRLEIPMCDHISQARDQAPGPSIPSAVRNRSANPSVAGKNLPDTGSPLRQETRQEEVRHRVGKTGARGVVKNGKKRRAVPSPATFVWVKGNGALEMERPFFHRLCGKTM